MKDNNIENLFQKGKTEKPPASLDNFILAQAKNSCDEKQSSPIKNNRNRWLYSLSSAAVVVLSFSVILNLQHENTQISDQPIMLERSSTGDKAYKRKNNPSPKKSANKVINDPVPESPLAVTEAESEPVDTYEIAESLAPIASGVSTHSTENKSNEIKKYENKKYENKPVARSLPKAITAAPKKAKDEARFKEEEQTPILQAPKITQSIEKELQNSDYSTPFDDSEKLDSITVTGSRLMSEPMSDVEETVNSSKESSEELSLTQKLEQLDNLIKDKKLVEAKQMLQQLQKFYTYYNFSKYENVFE